MKMRLKDPPGIDPEVMDMVPAYINDVYSGAYALVCTQPIKGIDRQGKDVMGTVIFIPCHPDHVVPGIKERGSQC